MLIRMTLGTEDLMVECVSDASSALAAARVAPVGLFIIDDALGDIDGYTLSEMLRKEANTSTVPILLLVADYDIPDMDRVGHIGIQAVLAKPFEQHGLLEQVRGILGLEPAQDGPTPPQGQADDKSSGFTSTATEQVTMDAQLEEHLKAWIAEGIARQLDPTHLADVEQARNETLELASAKIAQAILAPEKIVLGDDALSTLQASIQDAIGNLLMEHSKEVLVPFMKPLLEPIIWKLVPEMAEDMIREEISRLTEDGEQ
jgi:DNA-binding response OmpR family regulator